MSTETKPIQWRSIGGRRFRAERYGQVYDAYSKSERVSDGHGCVTRQTRYVVTMPDGRTQTFFDSLPSHLPPC